MGASSEKNARQGWPKRRVRGAAGSLRVSLLEQAEELWVTAQRWDVSLQEVTADILEVGWLQGGGFSLGWPAGHRVRPQQPA